MGWKDYLTEWITPAAHDDNANLQDSLSANQGLWEEKLGVERGGTSWKNYAAGGLGFLSWVGYETGAVDLFLDEESEKAYNSMIDKQLAENGSVYNDLFINKVSETARGLLWVGGWLAFSSVATLVLPIITELNKRVQSLDPLLRPPRRGLVRKFNPLSNIEVVMSYNVTFDPIRFGVDVSGVSVTFNPVPVASNPQVIRVLFNPILV